MKLQITTGNTAQYFDTASCPKPESGYMLDGHRPLYFPDENALCNFFADICCEDTTAHVSDWMRDDKDTAILICLNAVVSQLWVQQQPMHAVLAQTIPIFGHVSLQPFVMTYMRQCLESGMVSIQPLALSNSIPTVSASGLARLIESNQRTMRKNNNIRIIQTAVDEDFFNMQRQFSMVRFGIPISTDEEYIQRLIYRLPGFFMNTYVLRRYRSLRTICVISTTHEKPSTI